MLGHFFAATEVAKSEESQRLKINQPTHARAKDRSKAVTRKNAVITIKRNRPQKREGRESDPRPSF